MTNVTLREVLEVTNGRLLGNFNNRDVEISAVEQNTRHLVGGSMFIPYKGKNVDGHTFIRKALENGCIGCMTEKLVDSYVDGKFYVLVDNVVDALWKIVDLKRKKIHAKLICVTGSVGKTTTTGMIASVLSQKYSVFKTEDNWNDEFLCPEMIFKIQDSHDFAVMELGLGEHSSVKKMARFLKPDAIVLTRIGHAHIGITGSLEATRDEKCGTENGLPDDGVVFANADDLLISAYHFSHNVVPYGRNKDSKFLPEIKPHLEYAAYAAIEVGSHYGLSMVSIFSGISQFHPEAGRMDVVHKNDFTLIDSSFNASIESIELAINMLSSFGGNRVAVLGEMLEVGDYSEALHRKVGELVTDEKVDVLISIGEHARTVANAAGKNVVKYSAEGIDDAINAVDALIKARSDNVILCKGSHGSNVWMIADHLKLAGK